MDPNPGEPMLLLAPPPPPPPVILVGAALWQDDGTQANLQEGRALLIQKGKIAAIGTEADLLRKAPKAGIVRLEGGTLLPGFIEGHAHVESLGKLQAEADLTGAPSLEEALRRIQAWAGANTQGWITGRGWDQNLWSTRTFPAARDLEGAAGPRPAFLRRVDGHAGWANAAALREAGITRGTPDPKGGQILRDASGEPTGILLDNAMQLVEDRIPKPTQAQRESWHRKGLEALRNLGFTSVCDMGGDAGTLAAYRTLAAARALPIRVFSYFDWDPKVALSELRAARPATLSFFQVQGVKFYFDGALGSRGARMAEPYADAPGATGLWVMEPEVLGSNATVVLKAGYQVAAHAIGDAANHAAVAVLGAAHHKAGGLPVRVEHAQIVAPEDAKAFGPAGLVASVQPMHMADDHPWTPARLGPGRTDRAFPWRTFLAGGAPLVFGSDAPIADANPFRALAAAETRQDDAGNPAGGFLPEHQLTREEALRTYTSASAAALGRKDLGVLKAGAVADLLWVKAPVTSLSSSELRNVRPGRLWVNGVEAKLDGRE